MSQGSITEVREMKGVIRTSMGVFAVMLAAVMAGAAAAEPEGAAETNEVVEMVFLVEGMR